jgi:hypothetical protein
VNEASARDVWEKILELAKGLKDERLLERLLQAEQVSAPVGQPKSAEDRHRPRGLLEHVLG